MSILVVDDSPDALLLLESILKRAGYTEVSLAESPAEAFERLGKDDPAGGGRGVDLILMDIMMPEMDGIEACRQIKATEHLQEIPIIMVTARTDPDDLQTAFATGAVDYITKPLNKVELLARVRSILRLKHEMDHRKAREKELLEVTQQLTAANEILHRISSLDGLTGIANRRHFEEFFHKEWPRAVRDATHLSLIMCDIDFFKPYNDGYGHLAGDDCLKIVAKTIKDILKRPADFAARYGGEEFVIVLPNTKTDGAVAIAEGIRLGIEALGIGHATSPINDCVTISLGVASTIPGRNSKPNDLIAAADKALYEAKHEGRNQTKTAGTMHPKS